jgi:hypothetical protein
MTVDSRARSAADALNQATLHDLEVRVMLNRLHDRKKPRRAKYVVAFAAVVALVMGIGVLRLTVWQPHSSNHTAGRVATPFALTVPFTAVVPTGWSTELVGNALAAIESPAGPYVEVVVDPVPAATAASPAPKTLTAQSFAAWFAARPEVEPTKVVATTVAGLPAWQVDLKLRPGAALTASCEGGGDCVPLVRVAGVSAPLGLGVDASGRAIVVQLPNGHLIGIAEGVTNSTVPLSAFLSAVQPVVQSIDIPKSQ